MSDPDHITAMRWKRSSKSSGQNGDCVELAWRDDSTVFVRDSKNPEGPVLEVSVSVLTGAAKASLLDR